MLHHQYGKAPLAQALDLLGQLGGFFRIHSRRRLVQEQQTRFRSHGPHDFQLALQAIWQIFRQLIPQMLHVEQLQQILQLFTGRRFFPPFCRRGEQIVQHALLQTAMPTDEQVLPNRHIAE